MISEMFRKMIQEGIFGNYQMNYQNLMCVYR